MPWTAGSPSCCLRTHGCHPTRQSGLSALARADHSYQTGRTRRNVIALARLSRESSDIAGIAGRYASSGCGRRLARLNPMLRSFSRHDSLLATGFAIAAIVLFYQPLRMILDHVPEVERLSLIDFVLALVILCCLVAAYQYRRRSEARQHARDAVEAEHQRQRVLDLESVVAFGHAIGAAQSLGALEHVLWRGLPALPCNRPFWIAYGQGYPRRLLASSTREAADVPGTLIAQAERAYERLSAEPGDGDGVAVEAVRCFPLSLGESMVGVLAIGELAGPLDERELFCLKAAAGMIEISLRNVLTLAETPRRSLSDPLTGCYNRAYAHQTLTHELALARRAGTTTSLVMMDIDTFKSINDQFGHRGGDRALVAVAETMSQVFLGGDPTCRYAGRRVSAGHAAGHSRTAGRHAPPVGRGPQDLPQQRNDRAHGEHRCDLHPARRTGRRGGHRARRQGHVQGERSGS